MSLITAAFSAAAAYFGMMSADNRLEEERKYMKSHLWMILLITLSSIGGILSYFTANNTVSLYAHLTLMITYVMVSMAGIYDFKLKSIPNFIPLSLVITRVLIFAAEFIAGEKEVSFIISSLIGGFTCMLLLYIAMKITRGGIGYGDIKLFGAIGFCTGFYSVFAVLLFSLLVCAVFSLPKIAARKQKLSGDVPFAPFIYAGYVITLTLSQY
jgi:Flp pilus assembly protein protease CpaA